MEYLVLGILTSLSLILVIGAQNIFVIEQGLKKQFIFLVCIICSISDLILIFAGIFLFHYFNQFFTEVIELILNILLIIFLIYFIFSKIKSFSTPVHFELNLSSISKSNIIFKTLGFTYLNPHVYSDTVFFLGNFSKSFLFHEKIIFGIGACIASFSFFFLIGYLSVFFSKYAKNQFIWKIINFSVIVFMSILTSYIIIEII